MMYMSTTLTYICKVYIIQFLSSSYDAQLSIHRAILLGKLFKTKKSKLNI